MNNIHPDNSQGKYPPFLQEEHTIRAHECGIDRKLKFHILLDYLQDIAATHAELLDVGLSALTEKGTLWVLSRMKLHIKRYPACDEKIILKTYPSGVNGLFAVREYLMCSENGEELVKGTSFWLVIDAKTFRPMKAVSFLPPGMPVNEDLPRFYADAGKIERKDIPGDLSFTVRHGDIDMNRHLNNAIFARNILDTLCKKYNDFVSVKEIQLNFVNSGNLGEELCFGAETGNDGSFYVHALSPDGKKCYIQAEGIIA